MLGALRFAVIHKTPHQPLQHLAALLHLPQQQPAPVRTQYGKRLRTVASTSGEKCGLAMLPAYGWYWRVPAPSRSVSVVAVIHHRPTMRKRPNELLASPFMSPAVAEHVQDGSVRRTGPLG